MYLFTRAMLLAGVTLAAATSPALASAPNSMHHMQHCKKHAMHQRACMHHAMKHTMKH